VTSIQDKADRTGPPPPPLPRVEGRGTELWRLALVVGATVAFGIWAGLGTLAIVLALVFMIFMHELGHYVTAKAAGMKVTEFFIGFGPRLWSFRRGETEYGLKAIPAGAYVKVIGMSNLEEVAPEDEPRTYRQQPYWRRLSVAVAGSTMHFLMALVLIFVVLVGFGIPQPDSDNWSVGALTERSPAEEAGIELGDRIVAVDGRRFANFEELSSELRSHPGDQVTLAIERDGEVRQLDVTLAETNPQGEDVGFLGIGPTDERVREGLGSGVVESFEMTGETMWLSVKGLGSFFSPSGLSGYYDTLTSSTSGGDGDGDSDVESNPNRVVSIYGAVRLASATEEVADVLAFLFAINIFIGIFNLVPLLPLDGGHVAIATYERIRSRRGRPYHADIAKLMPLTYAVVLLLVLVGVTSLYLDIADPLQLQ
jgi:membrane-associated protease RseP (regulator of RpoE activity)